MKREFYEFYRKLGLSLNFHRKNKGMKQEMLSELVGINPSHLSKIESGSSAPSLDVVFGIAKALDVPVHKLFEFRE